MTAASAFGSLFAVSKPIIGMIHVLPQLGTPFFGGSLNAVIDRAVQDAQQLEAGGVDGILIQNRGDKAFAKDNSAPEIIASMTRVGLAVMNAVNIPVGFHLLRNDVIGSLAVAQVCGGHFIRVGCGIGATYLPQGIVEAKPSEVMAARARYSAEKLVMLSDVESFHYRAVVPIPAEEVAQELLSLGLADAVVVALPDNQAMLARITSIKARTPSLPVLIGGYATANTIAALLREADGAIVGGEFEQGGRNGPVVLNRVQHFMDQVYRCRAELA